MYLNCVPLLFIRALLFILFFFYSTAGVWGSAATSEKGRGAMVTEAISVDVALP